MFIDEANQTKSIDELFPQISASCFLDIFHALSPSAYAGLSEYFQLLSTEEINSMPRRALYQAREKIYSIDDQQSVQKRFYSLAKNFLSEENESRMKTFDSTNFNIACLLYSYEAPGDRNAEGVIVKRHIASHWRGYEETFGILLTKVITSLMKINSV